MIKLIVNSIKFSYSLRIAEALAALGLAYASSQNSDFTYIQASIIAGLFFVAIELVYMQLKVTEVKSFIQEVEQQKTNANEILRMIQNCGLPLDEVKQLFYLYSGVSEYRDPFYKELAQAFVKQLKVNLNELHEGYYEHYKGDEHTFVRLGMKHTRRTLDCVTTFDGEIGKFWTKKVASEEYLDAMKDALDRGVKITRIFCHSRNLTDEQIKVCETQQNLGIRVFLRDMRLNDEPEEESCFLISDSRVVADTVFGKAEASIKYWKVMDRKEKSIDYQKTFNAFLKNSINFGAVKLKAV